MAVKTEPIELIERAHYVLRATWISSESPRRAVIIAPATGVPARFYHPFANWLAARGSAVLCIDWPCVGESFARGVDTRDRDAVRKAIIAAGLEVNMNDDWLLAVELAINDAERRFGPAFPIIGVGNSNGFGLLTSCPSRRRLTRVLAVSANNPHYAFYDDVSIRQRVALRVLTFTDEHGYYPASKLGLGNDLTSGCGIDWAGWAAHPRYSANVFAHQTATYRAPTLTVCFSDDIVGSVEEVDKTSHNLPLADITRIYVDPAAVGWKPCGHVEVFRPHHTECWAKLFAPFIEDGTIVDGFGHLWSSRGPTIDGKPPKRVHAVDFKIVA